MPSRNRDVLKVFWNHLKKYKLVALATVIVTLILNGLDLIHPYLYKLFFDFLTKATPDTMAHAIASATLILFAIICIKALLQLFWRFADLLLIYLEPHVMRDINQSSFNYLERHSYQFFTNSFTGALVRKINRLKSSFEEITDTLVYQMIPQVLLTIGVITIIAFWKPVLAIILVIWIVVFVIINFLLFIKLQKYDLERAEKDSELTGCVSDSLSNNVNVKLFARFKHEEQRLGKVLEEWMKKSIKAWNYNEWILLFGGISFVLVELVITYVALQYYAQGQLTIGDFVMLQGYLTTLISRLWSLQRVFRNVFRDFSDAREMVDILIEPYDVQDARRAKPLKIAKGEVDFNDVTFFYNQTRKTLDQFDLRIKPGERVALVGPSGAGKSTVVKLLMRFYDIDKGSVTIDGTDISKVTQDSLREIVSLVPQDPLLFHRSLMENILYGKLDATENEVIQAAKQAHCHEFITGLSSGYDTLVGERGIKLSGGERQRVAIARAILKNAPILVLDEATSSLDSESESLIQDALKTLMKGKTTIVIAHRLSTIMQMDRIVVMEEGKIIDQGTHQELLKRQGMYKKLWEIQAGGFMPQ